MQLKQMSDMNGKIVKDARIHRYPDEGRGGGTLLEIRFTDESTINFNFVSGFYPSVEVTEVKRAR